MYYGYHGDGITNDKDLDSDGDGCPDAKEANITGTLNSGSIQNKVGGVLTTTTGVANTIAAGPYSGNGFADALQSSTDTNAYKLTYNYAYAIDSATNACTDTDGDGVADVYDLDDDNDGVLDQFEMTCTADATGTNKNLIGPSYYSNVTTNFATVSSTPIGNVINGDIGDQTAWQGTSNPYNPLIDINITCINPIVTNSLFLANDIGTTGDGVKNFTVTLYDINGNTLGTETLITNSASQSATETVPFSKTYYGVKSFKMTCIDDWPSGGGFAYALQIREIALIGDLYKVCSDLDTDGDGIPNRLDLDSDGDGCPDAKEAGVVGTLNSGSIQNKVNGTLTTTAGVANTIAAGPYSGNGFADALQSSTDTNAYKNTYTYYNAISSTINACTDTDGDGVPDLVDLDDDNDGILDAVEAPSCYYTQAEATTLTSVTSDLTVATIANTYDNNYATSSAMTTGQAIANKTVFQLNYSAPIQLSNIKDTLTSTTSIFANGATYYVQASNDGVNWVNVSSLQTAGASATGNGLNFPSNATTGYTSYRIYGQSGTTSTGATREFIPTFTQPYVPSANPKTTCTTDTDGDGITNDKDLDSDGDGCPDAKEASVVGTLNSGDIQNKVGGVLTTTAGVANAIAAGPYNSNGFADALQLSSDTNAYKGTYTYYQYALNATLNLCTDTDNDGVPDLIDIDDDNDGVLDAVESPNCYYTQNQALDIVSATSDLTFNATNVISRAIDSLKTTYATFSAATTSTGNTIMYNLKYAAPVKLTSIIDSLNSATSIFAAGATYRIEASNDNTTWTNVSAATSQTAPSVASNKLTLPVSPTMPYLYYRIVLLSGNTALGNSVEFSSTIAANYVPSSNPKSGCITDTDKDGTPNDKDLDSDGDGCSDAFEAGTTTNTDINYQFPLTTTFSLNGFVDSLQSAVDTNAYKRSYTYTSAIDSNSKSCCPTTAPVVSPTSISNVCPVGTVNLNTLSVSAGPSDTRIVWSTHRVPTSTSDTLTTSQLASVGTSGKYYVMYFRPLSRCFSNADSVQVNISTCPDTIYRRPTCPTCPVAACVTADNIVVSGSTTYSSCSLSGTPSGFGTFVLDLNGCLVWAGNGSQTMSDTIKSCVVACNGTLCDTTVVYILPAIPPYGPDTIIVPSVAPGVTTAPKCTTGDDLQAGTTNLTYSTCGVSSTQGSYAFNSSTGCATWTPNSTQVDTIKTCVVVCGDVTVGSVTANVCDTTFLWFTKAPVKDTIEITPSCYNCLFRVCPTADDITITSSSTFSSCGTPTGMIYKSGPTVEGCINYTLDSADNGIDDLKTCIVACDGNVCDTTVVIVHRFGVPLPVKFADFTVNKYENTQSYLKWITASEINNDKFEVERSADAMDWKKIGEVAGSGNSYEMLQYNFIDKHPLNGINYYRIKQVDFNGRFSYTVIKSLSFDNQEALNTLNLLVYPNPANNLLNIELVGEANEEVEVTIHDIQGRIVLSNSFSSANGARQIDIANLAADVYLVKVKTTQGVLTNRLVIHH